ncbi:alpha-tocopherol transfer protein-like [Agrilus planipennis]|uniref:Alpha-tocopherol transfer protein-like n=1 Tax=Agrilus planipennis TaxID=224129 RepID=A0A1W4X9A7_AGRPL|nr:alpha-tocopherol transfer protein-like [Agrilus planipennis]
MMSDRKWLTDPDEYICTLPEDTQKIAKEELGEDPNTRNKTIKAFRDWVVQNPRIINCRLDSRFLLRFLRGKKFSLKHAQDSLERYLLLRQTYGVLFSSLDMTIPMMEDLLQLGFGFACPKRDRKGRRVIVARPGVFDIYKFTNADMVRYTGIVCETLMEDEENQIRGFVYFADGNGVGLQYLTLFTPKEAVRLVKNGEKTVPMRHKEVHGIGVHPSMKFVLDFGFSLISEKIKKRVKLYSNINELITSGNFDPEILPQEYGGKMPMAEMIALWRKELEESHQRLLKHDEMEVREELFSPKAREGAISALKKNGTCGSEEDPLCGVMGNFRKLEID